MVPQHAADSVMVDSDVIMVDVDSDSSSTRPMNDSNVRSNVVGAPGMETSLATSSNSSSNSHRSDSNSSPTDDSGAPTLGDEDEDSDDTPAAKVAKIDVSRACFTMFCVIVYR